MSKREPAPLACIDANIFLAVLIPEATRAPKDEIAGAARVLKAVEEGVCEVSPRQSCLVKSATLT
jgi:hypothetical protein